MLAAEYNQFRLLTAGVRGHDPGLAGLVIKLHSSTLQYHVTKLAMDIMGDRALLAPGETTAPFSAMMTTAHMWYYGLALGGGAPNIQRNVIGERGLGLRRDLRK